MRAREALAVVLPVALAAMTVAPVQASAESTTVTFKQTCHGVPEKLAPPTDNTGQDVIVRTTSQSRVAVGDTVDVSVLFVPHGAPVQQLPLGAEIVHQYRIKTDLDLPDGFEIVDTSTSGASNISGVTVFTVNEAGEKDPKGRILRMASADNATVGNSPNSSANQPAGGSTPVSGDTITWQMPQLNFTMKATKPGTFRLGARNKGGADQPGVNPRAYITFLTETQAPLIGSVWAATYCTARDNPSTPFINAAKNLFTWTVTEKEPSAADVALKLEQVTATAGKPATVRVMLTPDDARGNVTFTHSDRSVTVPVENGVAEAEMTFDSPGEKQLKAAFTADGADSAQPVEITGAVKVAAQKNEITLAAPVSASLGETFTATATVKDAEGVVLFTLGSGKPVSVALKDGKAQAEIPVGDDTGEVELTAEFTPATGSPFQAALATATVKVDQPEEKETTATTQPAATTAETTSPLVASPEPEAGAPLAATATNQSKSPMWWLWIVAGLILLIAILIAVFAVKKKKVTLPDDDPGTTGI